MHKGNIKEDLRLQCRGQEPRFSCQFHSSSTGLESPLLLSGAHLLIPMPHCLTMCCNIHA